MEKFTILFVCSYCLIATVDYNYTIKALSKAITKNQSHLISMFNTLKVVSFIPVLNFFYLIAIIEDSLKS
jgi:hypothetical protein